MTKVYIAIGRDSEGRDDVLRVFAQPGDANTFLLRCEAHHKRRPKPPNLIEDTPENDALHENYWDKFTRWQKRHPGGAGAWTCDQFLCMTRKLYA